MKSNETYNTFHGPLSQELIDGRYWSPAQICHANQSNENLHKFDSGLCQNHVVAFYQVGCIDYSRNIPGLKQRKIHKQGNHAMKSQFWNPQIRSRVSTSLTANRSHLPLSVIGEGFPKPISIIKIRQLNPPLLCWQWLSPIKTPPKNDKLSPIPYYPYYHRRYCQA